jgi:hypothetical protein
VSAEPTPGATDPAAAGDAAVTIRQSLADLFGELPLLVSERVRLMALDLQRAGLALAQLIALILVTAILGVSAWLMLWVALGLLLVELGYPPSAVFGALVVPNAVAALFAASRIRALTQLLALPATVRRLTGPGHG